MGRSAYLLLFVIPFYFMGCKKSQAVIDNDIIQGYISSHHLNAAVQPNGVYFVPLNAGSGIYAGSASIATVTYKGVLPNDSVFSQSTTPYTSYLSQTIPGWSEGIQLMQKSQTAMVLIPSAMGYGGTAKPASNGYAAIPANSVLIFTITLISFQ